MLELPYAVEEAINRLRINISFLGSDIRKIMVISTFPNEGKSFIACQLWRQMAEMGKKSILLDMDLRNSVMVEKYNMTLDGNSKFPGTSDYLAGNVSLEEAILQTQFEKGDILPNVEQVVNPSLLIESRRFKEMLNTMTETYRYVFVDTPPLELVSDGEKIGSLCDGAILVVRGGSTSKRMVQNSMRQLERSGCPVLGVVLNRVETSKGGYYSKKYGYGYGYGYGEKKE